MAIEEKVKFFIENEFNEKNNNFHNREYVYKDDYIDTCVKIKKVEGKLLVTIEYWTKYRMFGMKEYYYE